MALVLDEEQTMLRDAAHNFLSEKAPISELRGLRDGRDETGYSKHTWSAMVEMGWAGIIIPEAYDGLGFSHVGAGMVMQEMGRTLTPSPYFSTSIVGATLIAANGRDEQKQMLLPGMAAGTIRTALALDESGRHRPNQIAMRAQTADNGFELSGSKQFVLDGHIADKLIVAARTSDDDRDQAGITLFLVDADAPGVTRRRSVMVDSRNAARIHFDQVRVSGDAVLGEVGGGFAPLDTALDVGRMYLAAEMAGIAEESFVRTIDYLKQRDQFGQKIGSFQALQHRAAHLYSEIELAKSVVLKGLQALDENSAQTRQLASMVKAKAGSVAMLATNEAVQMHGGIGMTDDFDIGFFMKRARVAQETFGDAAFHTDRLATLSGY
ncbi:MAG: acyl-CoA dehydrogenase [Pseudomonadota bacterium]